MTQNGIIIDEGRLKEMCRKWRIRQLALFGSILADNFRPDSDVDVLVDFAPESPWSLFDLMDLRAGLAILFGRKIDLVESAAIRNPYRRRSILTSRKVIYDAEKD